MIEKYEVMLDRPDNVGVTEMQSYILEALSLYPTADKRFDFNVIMAKKI